MNLAGAITGIKFTMRYPDTDKPLAFGKVYTYEENSSTLKNTWKDEQKQALNTNPIILDAFGQCDLFLDGTYRLVVKDKDEALIDSIDSIRDAGTASRDYAVEIINGFNQLTLDPAIVVPVAAHIDEVVAVGSNITKVITVANNIANVNTVAANIVDIQNAEENANIATTQAGIATTKASEASTSATSAATSATSASASASAANTSASNAATSESNALSYKNNAATSAANAATSETNASNSATSAATSSASASGYATSASNSAISASDSATLSQKWASNPEDVVVSGGLYSAYHYMKKAQSFSTGAASNISYDHTASGLTATNVQTAIDEVDNNLDTHISNTATALGTKANLNNPSFTNSISLGGVSLSTWANTFKVTELAGGTFFGSNGISALTGSNCYYDGVNWRYKADGSAGLQLVNQGTHQFRVASAGLADGVITWTTVATLNSDGTSTFNGTISGNASTATKLASAVTINSESFDGSTNINVEGRLGTAIPSAATTTIGTKGIGETVHITGTTTITSLGVSNTGTIRTVIFDGALVLTYNATSLMLPTSANITTVAGDTAIFVCENGASGYWRCISYVRRSGQSLGSAPSLTTARTINGVSFNGTANINIEDRLGTAIASAATITIGTSGLGDYIHITGTTTITSFGTASAAGIRRTLIFDGALTITNNATSLICTGNADIVTVAGMVIEVVAETTTNWRVVSITHPNISMAELGYLDGVTSNIQTQFGNIGTLTDFTTTLG